MAKVLVQVSSGWILGFVACGNLLFNDQQTHDGINGQDSKANAEHARIASLLVQHSTEHRSC